MFIIDLKMLIQYLAICGTAIRILALHHSFGPDGTILGAE
jgi:hypothetical protein